MSEVDDTAESHVGLQFSLYPLRQAHVRPAIEAAVRAATAQGVAVTVGRLRAAFDAARSCGPTVMVVTLSSGLPSAETVAGIQSASAV